MLPESRRCPRPQSLLRFDLRSKPDTELENPLKLLRFIKPPIAVTDRVGRKIIIQCVRTTEKMGKHMVCFPLVVVYGATADVTSAVCFGKNLFSLTARKCLSGHPIAQFELVITSQLPKRT